MLKRSALGPLLAPLTAAALALAVALAVFGLRIADPADSSWISGDAVTALFGWRQYLADPAQFFPVVSDRASWPLPMPLAVFDAIPIAALLAKGFAPLLPAQFHYFGLAFLTGVALQAIAAWALLREATRGGEGRAYHAALLIGALFFATAPILLVRFYVTQMALSIQWPLIAALWLYVRSARLGFWRSIRDFSALGFVAAAINPYTMVMVLLIYAAFVFKAGFEKSLRPFDLLAVLIPCLCALGGLILFGFVDPGGGGSIGDAGFGIFSASPLTLIEPMPKILGSQFIPALGIASRAQFEGFGYMGLGALLLVIGGLGLIAKRRDGGRGLTKPLLIAAALAYLWALSNVVTIGAWRFELPLPGKLHNLLENFRSSGRFIWVVVYALLFIAISGLIRLAGPRRAALLLLAAALIQIADLAGPLSDMHRRFAERRGAAQFTDAAYRGLGRAHDTLLVLPPWQCRRGMRAKGEYPDAMYAQFSNLAMENRLRTNSFYGGRTPRNQAEYHCEAFPSGLAAQPADRRTAYLLTPRSFREFGAHIAATHSCDFAEDFFLCRGDGAAPGLTPRARQALSVAANSAL